MSPASSDTHLLRTGWGRRGCKRVLANECSIVSICKRRILLLICQIVFLPAFASQLGEALSEPPKHRRHVVFTRTWFSFTRWDLLLCLCVVVYLLNDGTLPAIPGVFPVQHSPSQTRSFYDHKHNKLELRFLCYRHETDDRTVATRAQDTWIHHRCRVRLVCFCPWEIGVRKSWVTDPVRCNFPGYSRTSAVMAGCIMSAAPLSSPHIFTLHCNCF